WWDVASQQLCQGKSSQRKSVAIELHHVNKRWRIIEFTSFTNGSLKWIDLTQHRELPQAAGRQAVVASFDSQFK
ncbi:MAG: hypothetical protein JZU67_03480, partial [Burkholderiaceae bacterium]|nr:hypothetical protein [Burkholderiaceae bacterium]